MEADQQLDISGQMMPLSLALCKFTLAQMNPGEVLEIRLRDHDTFQDLLMIMERSGDRLLSWEKHEEQYSLWVRKNPGRP
ncbi:MAG: sulfurtransferase TusA family protein [Syntrophales bacterium]|nr:sulfurtransferase TusA family protein [Syntrophales bacterium]